MSDELILTDKIESRIFTIRGQKVMLDFDLALLYEVETKVLNQAVKRNIERFPYDFMFQLTDEEWNVLRSQIVTSRESHGGRRYLPYAFTEHGVSMLSSVLNSQKAIQINIQIMRAFIKLRQYIIEQTSKDKRIEEVSKLLMLHIENTDNKLSEHDKAIDLFAKVLNYLIEHPEENKEEYKKVGFDTDACKDTDQ